MDGTHHGSATILSLKEEVDSKNGFASDKWTVNLRLWKETKTV